MNRATFLRNLSNTALASEQATALYELQHADLTPAQQARIITWLDDLNTEITARAAADSVQEAA